MRCQILPLVGAGLLLWGAAGVSAEPPELPVFTETTEAAGLTFERSFGDFELDNIVEGTGAGPTFFDYDNDGLLDIYLVNGRWLGEVNDNRGRTLRGKLRNALYRNNGDGTFADVTEAAGLVGDGFGFSSSSADFDGDGDLDLYVCNYGENQLFRNNGDGTFTDIARAAGVANPRWSLSAPWLDYDGDGDLDLYVANYLKYDAGAFRSFYAAAGYPGPLSYSGQQDAMYRNNGDGTFTDVTEKAGIVNPNGRAMSAVAADIDNDGQLDVYVANDAMENYYYHCDGKGHFTDQGLLTGLAFGQNGQGVSSMGPATGDVDRDGFLDILVPDMQYGSLLVYRDGLYEDQAVRAQLAVICGQYTGWGGVLVDYDNDGYLDVFISNGNAHHEYTEDPVLARNDGKGVFVDVARSSGGFFQGKYVSRGTAYGDFDNDGDMDLLVMDLNGKPHLLRNDGGNRNHWLKLDVRAVGGKRTAIGARVAVTVGGLRQIDDVVAVRGYLSGNDPRPNFGLGQATKADLVEVRWPGGKTRRLSDVDADQILTLVPGD